MAFPWKCFGSVARDEVYSSEMSVQTLTASGMGRDVLLWHRDRDVHCSRDLSPFRGC